MKNDIPPALYFLMCVNICFGCYCLGGMGCAPPHSNQQDETQNVFEGQLVDIDMWPSSANITSVMLTFEDDRVKKVSMWNEHEYTFHLNTHIVVEIDDKCFIQSVKKLE